MANLAEAQTGEESPQVDKSLQENPTGQATSGGARLEKWGAECLLTLYVNQLLPQFTERSGGPKVKPLLKETMSNAGQGLRGGPSTPRPLALRPDGTLSSRALPSSPYPTAWLFLPTPPDLPI